MCVIPEYQYYTMSLSQYHGWCQYHKSMSIPWVFANNMSPCLYHESMSKPWVHAYTMSLCLYHNSDFIPWVHVYTISLCQIHAFISIPWLIQFSAWPRGRAEWKDSWSARRADHSRQQQARLHTEGLWWPRAAGLTASLLCSDGRRPVYSAKRKEKITYPPSPPTKKRSWNVF